MVVGLRYGMTGARSLGMGSGRVSRACFASPRSTVDVVPDGGRDELDARIHTLTLSRSRSRSRRFFENVYHHLDSPRSRPMANETLHTPPPVSVNDRREKFL
jgi:hypothetical protein